MRLGVALLALAGCVLLVGCGSGGELRVLAYSERFAVAEQQSFAVLGTQLGHERCWAFGEPAHVLSSLAPRYRPPDTPLAAESAANAPARLAALLATAQAELEARGYTRAADGAAPDLVALLSHSSDAGNTARVGLHLGGEVGGVYRPDWVSVAIEVDSDDEVDPEELLRELFAIVPARGPAD